MVANWASSRGHIGLVAAPCGGGGGLVCATASAPNSMAVRSTAQAATDLERIAINFSGMSRHQGNSWCPILTGLRGRLAAQGHEETRAAMRRFPASFTRFSGRRHVVSAAIVRSIGAACRNLAARDRNRGIQRWQVMAMYSPQPERLQFS